MTDLHSYHKKQIVSARPSRPLSPAVFLRPKPSPRAAGSGSGGLPVHLRQCHYTCASASASTPAPVAARRREGAWLPLSTLNFFWAQDEKQKILEAGVQEELREHEQLQRQKDKKDKIFNSWAEQCIGEWKHDGKDISVLIKGL